MRGGENVYCVEIENCIGDHPEIEEAAVIGVPDTELGERVKAIVRRAPGSTLDARGVRAHVGAHLASSRFRSSSSSRDEPLPRNPAGKLLKNVLRGQATVSFDTSMLE